MKVTKMVKVKITTKIIQTTKITKLKKLMWTTTVMTIQNDTFSEPSYSYSMAFKTWTTYSLGRSPYTKPNLKKNHLHTAKVMIMGSSMKYGVIVDDNIVSISEDG